MLEPAEWVSGAQWADTLDVDPEAGIGDVLGADTWKAVKRFCRKFDIEVSYHGSEGMAFGDFPAVHASVLSGASPSVTLTRGEVAQFATDGLTEDPHNIGERLRAARAKRFREQERANKALRDHKIPAGRQYTLDTVAAAAGADAAEQIRTNIDRHNRRFWNTPRPHSLTERTHLVTALELVNDYGVAPTMLATMTPATADDRDTALDALAIARPRHQNEQIQRTKTSDDNRIEFPAVTPLADLLNVEDEPVRYLIENLWPDGGARILCAAAAKSGKTTLCCNLVRSLADGDDFLGAFAVHRQPNHIVLIDNEMNAPMLRRWLRFQKVRNVEVVADVVTLRGQAGLFDLGDDRKRARWVQRLRDLGCDFLIFDCLKPVIEAMGLDENREAGKFLYPFDALLAEAGIPDALVTHHMGHQGQHARGDSTMLGWSDGNWKVVRNPADDTQRLFSAPDVRDAENPVAEGLLILDEGRLTYNGELTRRELRTASTVEKRLQLVLDVLAEAQSEGTTEMTTTAVKNLTGGKKEITDEALRIGVERRHIAVRESRGRSRYYSIVPAALDPTNT